jgi:hypothetical protein
MVEHEHVTASFNKSFDTSLVVKQQLVDIYTAGIKES